MAAEPTYEDFDERLRRSEAAVYDELTQSIRQLIAGNAALGRLNSGATVKGVMSLFETAVTKIVDENIASLQLFIAKSSLDNARLRETISEALTRSFKALDTLSLHCVRNVADSPSVVSVVNARITKQWEYIRYRLRQLDIGLSEQPPGSISSVTNNTIHAQTIVGGVQQGTHQTMQVSNANIDIQAIQYAVQAAEAALAQCPVGSERSEIEGDLATVKAQLQKATPSRSILSEAGKSLRNLTEGVAAGLLTPGAVSALAALITALGLG